MILKYIKKPIKIEAIQFTGENELEIMNFLGTKLEVSKPPRSAELDRDLDNQNYFIIIPTLEGNMKCIKSDYVIKGIKGEFYPCKEDIFIQSYEKVE